MGKHYEQLIDSVHSARMQISPGGANQFCRQQQLPQRPVGAYSMIVTEKLLARSMPLKV
jgi:hypothetical protein